MNAYWLGWTGLAAVSLAAGFLAYALVAWVPRREGVLKGLQQRWQVLREEPLLWQVWRFTRVLVSGQGIHAIARSVRLLHPDVLDDLLGEAGLPWGLSTSGDFYALGLISSMGVFTASAYLMEYQAASLLLLPTSFVLGFGLPLGALHLTAVRIRQAKILELRSLISALELYVTMRQGLYQAIKEAAYGCELLGPALERALLQWPSIGAERALAELSRDLRFPEAQVIIGALRQAVHQDPAHLALFMARENIRLEQYLRARQEAAAQWKPMVQRALLVLPAINIFIVVAGPMAYAAIQQLNAIL